VQIIPRFVASTYFTGVTFIRSQLYQGEIRLGGERYEASLGEDNRIRGRLDQPDTA
jgi:hypothetical protein